ncbi:hypothetical protein LEP1GSC188_3601 [Leptospira weilii serovar Topaz str. LT2116]|uniref:Uncharacterized protein n=1 Tax=Leptospira weilii serovar Topaz str. LT2116 TaxID=1088540 RepID=M3GWA5_9LEPT|nr:hypothetical protein LEP1GSC188_3601 [Leptospira weilii serovar Topaz str. LT2116]
MKSSIKRIKKVFSDLKFEEHVSKFNHKRGDNHEFSYNSISGSGLDLSG